MRSSLGTRLAVSLYAGLAAYCLLSLTVGPAGLLPYASLERRLAAMADNLERLETLNAGLGAELGALSSDPDRVRMEARSLGYAAPGENEIVIAGKSLKTATERPVGEVLRLEAAESLPDAAAKRMALLVASVVAVLLLFSKPLAAAVPLSVQQALARGGRARRGTGASGGA